MIREERANGSIMSEVSVYDVSRVMVMVMVVVGGRSLLDDVSCSSSLSRGMYTFHGLLSTF